MHASPHTHAHAGRSADIRARLRRFMRRQVAGALDFLHRHPLQVCHRDVRLDNVLITSFEGHADGLPRPTVKLAEFGLSRALAADHADGGLAAAFPGGADPGSVVYTAPEVALPDAYASSYTPPPPQNKSVVGRVHSHAGGAHCGSFKCIPAVSPLTSCNSLSCANPPPPCCHRGPPPPLVHVAVFARCRGVPAWGVICGVHPPAPGRVDVGEPLPSVAAEA